MTKWHPDGLLLENVLCGNSKFSRKEEAICRFPRKCDEGFTIAPPHLRRRQPILRWVAQRALDATCEWPWVRADLAAWGAAAGPELVRSVMRELGLQPCQPKPWRHSLTERTARSMAHPRPRQPRFHRGKAGRENGRGHHLHLNLAGLALSRDRHRLRYTENRRLGHGRSITRPRSSAAPSRWPPATLELAEEAVFHSDRGSNYTSGDFAKTPEETQRKAVCRPHRDMPLDRPIAAFPQVSDTPWSAGMLALV